MNIPHMAIVDGHIGDPVIVTQGEIGFKELHGEMTGERISKFNETMGADTLEKLEAMKAASMFGWEIPMLDVFK